jgi:hypothetical protein
MATRRVEGERLDVALEKLGQRTEKLGQRTDKLGQRSRTQPAKPLNLDPVRARSTGPLEFDDVVEAVAAQPMPASTPPLSQDIVDFVMPRLTDTTVLQEGRSVSILEQLVANILPRLAGGDELRQFANAIITDELERRRDLSTRVQAGITA